MFSLTVYRLSVYRFFILFSVFSLLCSQVVLSLSAELSLQVSLTEKRRKKGNIREIEKLFVYFMAKNLLRFDALTMHS